MSAHLARRREGVVALTHTEIMLVLATIILLLLLVKSNDLVKEREKVIYLLEQTNQSNKEADEHKRQIDLGREVKRVLVDNELVEENDDNNKIINELEQMSENAKIGEAVQEQLGPNALNPDTAEQTIAKLKEEAEVAREILRQSGEDEVVEAIRQLRENAAMGIAARESLGGNIASVEELKQGIRELKIGDLSRTIGCTPCWLGSGDRKYYFTYNITYSNGLYDIKPHVDWGRGVEIVDDALSGGLSVLRDHPKDLMTRDEFLAFGRKVDLHKNRHHDAECSLMASINEEANGEVVKFVHNEVNFCPIYR